MSQEFNKNGQGVYVQFGCGLCAPKTWQNFDASPSLWLQKMPMIGPLLFSHKWKFNRDFALFPSNVNYGDIVKGLPVAPNSCDAIYCSHVLEHLTLDEFRIALRNVRQYLKQDGIFRFVLPDLEELVRDYVHSDDPAASLAFIENLGMGCQSRPKGMIKNISFALGHSLHRWMWDYKSMAKELESAGFREIRRAGFNDSNILLFKDVEAKDRWEKSLGVECKK